MRRRPTPLVALLAGAAVLAGCGGVPAAGRVEPGAAPAPASSLVEGWPTTTPGHAGFRPARLRSLAREAKRLDSTCFAVLRDGRLVLERNWGQDRTAPREVWSVTKSVASALVGIAVHDGDLALDDPVADYVEEWRGTPSADVTVRHLLSNDSGRFWSLESDYVTLGQAGDRTSYAVGLEQQHEPGTAWAYNNAAIQVLDRVIGVATGQRTADLAAKRLFGPLGMARTRMTADTSGRSTNTYFGVQTTCLDLAKFARLYLRGGRVGDERLLPRAFVRSSLRSSTPHNAAYGHLWWLNRYGVLRGATDPVDEQGQPLQVREGRLVPGAPASIFAAIGLGGQVAMVDPGSRTVVVRLGTLGGDAERAYGLPDAARVVTEALRD